MPQQKKIKEFLETNYSRGRAIGVFRWFHFDLKVKNRNSYILPYPDLLCKSDLSFGEVKSETPRQSLEELFD